MTGTIMLPSRIDPRTHGLGEFMIISSGITPAIPLLAKGREKNPGKKKPPTSGGGGPAKKLPMRFRASR